MKKSYYVFPALILFILSCTTEQIYEISGESKWKSELTNDLLFSEAKISYKVEYGNDTLAPWLNQYDPSAFLESAFTKVNENTISAYDPVDFIMGKLTKITPDRIKDRLKQMNDKFDIQEIKSIGFDESWSFNSQNMVFEKKVQSWFPVRHFYDKSDTLKQTPKFKKVFNIAQDTKSPKTKLTVLAQDIQSEYSFHPEDFNGTNVINYPNLISKIVSKVKNGDLKIYDSRSVPELKEMTMAEITDKYPDWEILQMECTSLIFHEDWFYDPQSMNIFKQVKGVTLVRDFFREGEMLKKRVCYVKFNI